MNISESTARIILMVTGTTASIAYILAIYFGLQGDSFVALACFIVAIGDSAFAYYAYRQYTRLRGERWQSELNDTQQKMADLLAEKDDEHRTTATDDPNA